MTEESIKIENKEECFCKNRYFKKFLTVALGSFVGVFCALNLFFALHKPPMHCPHPPVMKHHGSHGFERSKHKPDFSKDFHKKDMKNFDKKHSAENKD